MCEHLASRLASGPASRQKVLTAHASALTLQGKTRLNGRAQKVHVHAHVSREHKRSCSEGIFLFLVLNANI